MDENHNYLGQPIGFPIINWHDCHLPPRSPMTGVYCCVEPLDPEVHAETIFQAYTVNTDHKNWTYLPYGPFQRFDEFFTWLKAECTGDDPLFHAIIDSKTGKAVGVASYLRIEPKVGVIEVGHIHYSPTLQNTPTATEAMYLMMRRVFDDLGYRRYEWKCDALNAGSRKAALRLGFSFEGIFRQATLYKDRNRDTAWYAIIDQEWPMLKGVYQAWLEPENFDNDGQQRQSLTELINQSRNNESQ